MWQSKICIVRPQISNQVKLAITKKELQHTSAGYIPLDLRKVTRVKELDYGLPGVFLGLKQAGNIGHLIYPAPIVEPWTIRSEEPVPVSVFPVR